MKVAVNLLWLVPGTVGGSETAAVGLLRQLARDRPADVDLELFALEAFGASYPELVTAMSAHLVPLSGRSRAVRVAAENTWLARQIGERYDLVHHQGGVVPFAVKTPGVMTLHDLQPFDLPDNFTVSKRLYLRRTIPRSLRRARVVITASQFVRQGVIDRFGVAPERVHVTPFGMEPPSTDVSVAEVQARYHLPRRWFVYPSFTWWHKDHVILVDAFAQIAVREYDVMLVLTGGEGPAEAMVMDRITKLGLRDRVRRTGLIPRRDVLAIMRGAAAVTFPSHYEGFGLPALEAMHLGVPLLAANATALPELVGDAGVLLPVGDADAWAGAMAGMLEDGDERHRLIAAGRERAAGHTWAATAAATVEAYRAAVEVGDATGPAEPGEDAPDAPDEKNDKNDKDGDEEEAAP